MGTCGPPRHPSCPFPETRRKSSGLSRVNPEVEIRTNPSGADIFTDASIGVNSRSIGKTPKIYNDDRARTDDAALVGKKVSRHPRDLPCQRHRQHHGRNQSGALTDPQAIDAQKTPQDTQKTFLGFTLMEHPSRQSSRAVFCCIWRRLPRRAISATNWSFPVPRRSELPGESQDNRHYANHGDKEAVAGGICFRSGGGPRRHRLGHRFLRLCPHIFQSATRHFPYKKIKLSPMRNIVFYSPSRTDRVRRRL